MIKLIKSTFYKEQATKRQLAAFLLKANILSMGEECKKFEKKFSKTQKRKYAVFVSNGSMANLVLIQSLLNLHILNNGDAIGVSSLTWATNIMPLIQLGLKPVPIDCEAQTLNVSPEKIKPIVNKLKGLFVTNVLGFCDDLIGIKKLCDENGIVLIEDNCESLGSQTHGKLLGNFGLASTFSFFVGHHLSTIEGGMICTDDKKLYDMLIMVRAHGWDRNLDAPAQSKLRHDSKVDDFNAKYTFYDLAYNARPNEINGFLGNIQIDFLNTMVDKREKNYFRLDKAVKLNDDFLPLRLNHMNKVSNFAMPIICRTKELYKKYLKNFEGNDIEIRPIIAGDITKQPFFKKYVKSTNVCENSRFIHEQGFYIPNNPELSRNEIKVLVGCLKKELNGK